MIKLYVEMIRKGMRTLAEVPEWLRAEVEAILAAEATESG